MGTMSEATESSVLAFRQFCVVCAKPEEAAEVIRVFDERFERDPATAKGASDHVYMVPGDHDRKLMVTTCADMGHISAAVRTAQVLALHRPGVMVFVGTAASLNPHELQLGDVVIPKKALLRTYEKVSQKGQADYEERVCQPDFRETFFDDNALIANMDSIKLTSDANDIVAIVPRDIALDSGEGLAAVVGGEQVELRSPKVVIDVDIISCGMVVDSVSYRDFLNRLRHGMMRKAYAIDMESFGFFQAVESTRRSHDCTALMIRGISDYAGRKQQTEHGDDEPRPSGWKERATRNAGLVVAALFETLADRAKRTVPPSR
jgi:nucleoside phosphorylase